jgi:hypothetical protein
LVSLDTGRQPFVSAAGIGVSTLTIHKATFVVWGIVTGAHTLGRLIPALQLTVLRWSDDWHVPGRRWRSASLVAAIVSGALAAVLGWPLPARGGRRAPIMRTSRASTFTATAERITEPPGPRLGAMLGDCGQRRP